MFADLVKQWFGPAARPRWILAVVVLVELILFIGYHQERWRKGLVPLGRPRASAGEGLVIRCDGHGYYAWLRSLLIDGDWQFDNEFDEHNVLGDFVTPPSCRTATGARANQWSVGPACVWAIPVVLGHGCVCALQQLGVPWSADGYELPYQLLVGGTSLLASFLGLWFLYRISRHFAEPLPAALAAAFLTLGTTIVFYSAIEVTMAHGLGAVAVAALAWYWLKTYGSTRPGRWFLVGVLVGVAALMRWQLATFVFLPLAEVGLSYRRWRVRQGRGCRQLLESLSLAALGALLGFLPQLIAWRCVYGHWLMVPMPTIPTSNNWLTPSWGQILTSQDRGLLYWTPLVGLAWVGYGMAFGKGCKAFFTPKGLDSAAQGRAAHPGKPHGNPKDLPRRGCTGRTVQPLRGRSRGAASPPRVRCATLGCAIQPLRGKDQLGTFVPNTIAARGGEGTRDPSSPAPPLLEERGEPLYLLFGAFLVQLYVLASIWGEAVQLGVSYGLRHLTDSLPVLAPALALLLGRPGSRRFRLVGIAGCLLVLWNLLLIAEYRYGLIPAASGADPASLLQGALRLLYRKRLLLLGQVLLGPILLAVLLARSAPQAATRARG
jgi:hypothetical protein